MAVYEIKSSQCGTTAIDLIDGRYFVFKFLFSRFLFVSSVVHSELPLALCHMPPMHAQCCSHAPFPHQDPSSYNSFEPESRYVSQYYSKTDSDSTSNQLFDYFPNLSTIHLFGDRHTLLKPYSRPSQAWLQSLSS